MNFKIVPGVWKSHLKNTDETALFQFCLLYKSEKIYCYSFQGAGHKFDMLPWPRKLVRQYYLSCQVVIWNARCNMIKARLMQSNLLPVIFHLSLLGQYRIRKNKVNVIWGGNNLASTYSLSNWFPDKFCLRSSNECSRNVPVILYILAQCACPSNLKCIKEARGFFGWWCTHQKPRGWFKQSRKFRATGEADNKAWT